MDQDLTVHTAGAVRIRVLGLLAVEHDGAELHVAGSHRRKLLAFLATRPGRAASVDAIADALWGEHPPATATKSIHNHVARLRSSFATLEHDLIETTGGGYRLAVDAESVDAFLFERLAADGKRRLAAGDAAGALAALTEGMALWRGQAYSEHVFDDFAAGEVARLDELRWGAMEDLAEARLQRGSFAMAIADLERLVQERPGRERSWALLIRAQYAASRQRDALATYQRAREVLVEEFGLEPGPELRDLERRVLEQDPDLVLAPAPSLPLALRLGANPFVGRAPELRSLVEAWELARRASGGMRLVHGPVDSGRTRLAAELATVAVADGGYVLYVRGEEGFDTASGLALTSAATPGAAVDALVEHSRKGPVLVVVDDAEWSSGPTVTTIAASAAAIEHARVLLVVIADDSKPGAAVEALHRLDPERARTLRLEPMDDSAVVQLAAADGVDADGRAAVAAVAGGMPGVARREAAAWAERVASERLTRDSASSIDARTAAADARTSVFDDVLALVAARARRDELTAAAWIGRQPYRSLAAYEPHDADLFVGREQLVAELAARVLERRLVAVIGASGSGKSSLVRAGLVPLVRSGRLPGERPWRAEVIVPGRDPIATLDAVEHLDEPEPMLLVVDQFEELFASGVAQEFAARVIELSADAALDVRVVLVMRADQYPALAALRPLAAAAKDAHVLIGSPTVDELHRIVEVPARRTGCAVEPALTARIVEDFAGHEAALPLVSAALAEVWEGRAGETLDVARYLEIGGLAAAVLRMGEKAVARGGEVPVREVMLPLVDITEDGQWVRRRVDSDTIAAELAPAVDALVDARLVQRDEQQIHVVHEVVFTAWPLLRSWLDEARAELVLERDLRTAARAWAADDRSDDYLYRGARLAAARELSTRRLDVDPLVADFVHTSTAVAERAADERARQQARTNRRLRGLLAGVAVALVAALVSGGLAFRQADRAERSADASQAEATRADARAAGDRALATAQIDRALLLAVAGVRLHDSAQTRANLLEVLAAHPGLIAPERSTLPGVIAVDRGGERYVSYSGDRLTLHDAASSDVLVRSDSVPHVQDARDVTFSPNGRELAVLHYSHATGAQGQPRQFAERPLVLYDAATLRPMARQLGGLPAQAAGQQMAYSADGRFLAVSISLFASPTDPEPTASPVLVWDLAAPDAPIQHIETGAVFNGVALSADGSRMYAAVFPPGDVRAYETATGRLVGSIEGVGGRMAATADGTTLAVTGLIDGRVTLLDAATLGARSQLQGGTFAAYGPPAFSSDGRRVAVPDWDAQSVIVWDVETGELVEQLVGHTAFVPAVWFGDNDGTVYAIGDDDSIVAWDLRGSNRFLSRRAAPPGFTPAETALPAPEGGVTYLTGMFGSSNPTSAVRLRDADSDDLRDEIDVAHGGIGWVAWRPDGGQFASAGQDGFVRVWDARSGRLLTERRVATGPSGAASALINGIEYARDGKRVVVAEGNGAIYALEATTLAPAGPRYQLRNEALGVVRGPSDDVFIVLIVDPTAKEIRLVDVAEARVVRSMPTGFSPSWAAMSPDRSRIAVAGIDGAVRIFDHRVADWAGPPIVGHQALVSWVSWSADGSRVVSGSADGRVALWDGRNGALMGTLRVSDPGSMPSPEFVGDSTMVRAVSTDGTISTFDTELASWISFACAVAGRDLTAEEWRAAFGDRPYRKTCRF